MYVHCQWQLSGYDGRDEWLRQRLYDLQSLKYILSGPLQKNLPNSSLGKKDDVQSQEGTLGTKREVKLRITRHRSEGEEKKLMVLVWMIRMRVPGEEHSWGVDNEFVLGKF